MPPTLRVLLAHPALLVREALGRLLATQCGLTVSTSAADLDAARDRWPGPAPDVALVCASLVRDSDTQGLPPAVVLLGRKELTGRGTDWLGMGPAGLVTVWDAPEVLVEALEAVAAGAEGWVSPAVSAAAEAAVDPAAALTRRERDVLLLAAHGLPVDEIGEYLTMTPGTVRNHLAALYPKLGVKTRAEAVAWAWRNGLLCPERTLDLPPPGGKHPTHDI